jgi:hypothetical protein
VRERVSLSASSTSPVAPAGAAVSLGIPVSLSRRARRETTSGLNFSRS